MTRRYPTYRLGPDFRKKLARFRDRVFQEGFEEFAAEFAQLDEFIGRAREENSPETLRRTPKEEYLLEALYFSVHDELNREAFNQTKDTLIIVPDCLSLNNPKCERTEGKYGDTCARCDKSCQSYWVMELASEYGATVSFAKRKMTEQIEHHAEKMTDVGVIGIACMIMLASGIRSCDDLGIPARGVLLSFCGCEHWNDEPFGSRFPMSWLKEILEEKRAAQAG